MIAVAGSRRSYKLNIGDAAQAGLVAEILRSSIVNFSVGQSLSRIECLLCFDRKWELLERQKYVMTK